MFEQTFKNIDDVLWKEAGCATELDYTEQTSWILFLKYLDDLEKANEQKALLAGKTYQPIIDTGHRWSVWAAPKKADGSFNHDKAKTGPDLIDYVDHDLFPYLQGFRSRAEGSDTIEYKIGEIFSEIKNRFQSGYSLRDALELMDGLSFRSQDQKHELSHIYEAKLKNMGNAGRNGGEYYTPRPLIRAMIKVIDPKIGERIYDGACGSAGFLCEAFDYLRGKATSTRDIDKLQKQTFFGKEKKTDAAAGLRGRRWTVAADDNGDGLSGYAPAIGAGGRFIRRADKGKPFARGLKAADPSGRAAALAACGAASRLSRRAQAKALVESRFEATLDAIDATNLALAALNRFRRDFATPAAARPRRPRNAPAAAWPRRPANANEWPREAAKPKGRKKTVLPPSLYAASERAHLRTVEATLQVWQAFAPALAARTSAVAPPAPAVPAPAAPAPGYSPDDYRAWLPRGPA